MALFSSVIILKNRNSNILVSQIGPSIMLIITILSTCSYAIYYLPSSLFRSNFHKYRGKFESPQIGTSWIDWLSNRNYLAILFLSFLICFDPRTLLDLSRLLWKGTHTIILTVRATDCGATCFRLTLHSWNFDLTSQISKSVIILALWHIRLKENAAEGGFTDWYFELPHRQHASAAVSPRHWWLFCRYA